ncbi:HAD family hydrolase [Hymenobacter arizonensis]|uniref:Haloacid dehalogenase superfamily, subfamily IA, variant 3 with third motif having DD or ED/haloacid dehalogenase superfamily, subfamily IA, variant 1 with third motif having Dx(3-4)D or Dx(3-4)E n=1 Tax=Hymenobacter arizonensis TaxID=1227077 RepID=A0A1I5TA37_HYMAR|nr:HAD family hydrolase [Hymenobacter arizonensis]SFP79900.1 haloacid dehalogenase superfamily, subfamily IA, variant 3 with third motif having DD or ED/haloacid dehalogenase superfamily, subfamily IA, variant 1 with third motif having Dx(3-4)D or Dx(3-4)E [Hymenobacter arizonensis]
MIRTVIFDMDGVIIDTEPTHRAAFFTLFEELGILVTPEEYNTFLGKSTRNVFQTLKQQYHLQQDVEDLLARKRALFNKSFDEDAGLDLLPGVRNLLDDLQAHDVQLVLASSASKGTIARVFQRFELTPYFSHVVSGEDFERSKPDPAIFLHAAELSETPLAQCIVIEDSGNGVAAAKAAGIYCIGYASMHSAGQNLHQADRIIQDFAELTAAGIVAITPA